VSKSLQKQRRNTDRRKLQAEAGADTLLAGSASVALLTALTLVTFLSNVSLDTLLTWPLQRNVFSAGMQPTVMPMTDDAIQAGVT
jgi:hypothetical protein